MKKVLFASTALVATAGVAAADVSLKGKAEMGIFGGDAIETQFFQDLDVTFSMSGTTDNGLTFGATIDLDEGGAGAAAVANNSDDGGASIFVSSDFGTLTMGDTDGALDWALTEAGNVGNPGSLNDDETEHAGYNGSYLDGRYDGQIVRYDNTFGDFGFAVSVEADDQTVGQSARNVAASGLFAGGTSTPAAGQNRELDPGFAIGLRYNLDLGGANIALGVGHQQADVLATANAGTTTAVVEQKATGISATTEVFQGVSFGVVYTKFENRDGVNVDTDHIGVGAGFSTGALSLHANWGQYDVEGGTETDAYGLAAAYDLGGGLELQAGYASDRDGGTAGDQDTFSFGASMSF